MKPSSIWGYINCGTIEPKRTLQGAAIDIGPYQSWLRGDHDRYDPISIVTAIEARVRFPELRLIWGDIDGDVREPERGVHRAPLDMRAYQPWLDRSRM